MTTAVSGAKAWWGDWGKLTAGAGVLGFTTAPLLNTASNWTQRMAESHKHKTSSNPGKFVMPNNVGPTIKPSGFNGGQVTINLNGIIDAEGSRRAIEKVLQKSSLRTGSVVVNRKVFTP